MPGREDIHTILIVGSGPIVIGQAAEFDYSGTQAIKALRRQGYRILLVNSNPATVMTEPDLADATYIEPLVPEALRAIIAQEKPDAFLPTVGGQTGLNLALALSEDGTLAEHQVQLIGASLKAIRIAEDRERFRQAMIEAGVPVPRGGAARSLEEARALAGEIGYPLLVRASFALGGSGAGWVKCPEELPEAVRKALSESPIGQIWLEESVLGWKEYELEVMRDGAGNFVVVCSIENLDPMGVHTGDSITVAPAQTLTDREYQQMRDMARRVMDAVGVETGGSNVQFAVDPASGRMLVIEMNPRVSRSSALASKATGFPIAKIAALVAVGFTLDEIINDITGQTVAAFEPALDYVVVKIPRWSFEKFPGVDTTLGPQMKSVGEAMAIGSTFVQALQKAVQSLEIGVDALDGSGPSKPVWMEMGATLEDVSVPTAQRFFSVYRALRAGNAIDEVARAAKIDPWFLAELEQVVEMERILRALPPEEPDASLLRAAKRLGFADSHLARLLSRPGKPLQARDIRSLRRSLGVLPVYKQVDTCAAEFEAQTPYLYSVYEQEDEAPPTGRPKILILGGGPNRIGQGIEFDTCCCQAAFALTERGYEVIMMNCNPETVSTDYDTSDRLYFEPMTLEHVLNIVDREQPLGVILQLGGQTPLNLAEGLEAAGVPILGTSPASIRLAEDRQAFAALLDELDIPHPPYGIAYSLEEGRRVAQEIGYPVLVRPSYVLGGQAMAIVDSESSLEGFLQKALDVAPNQAVLIDRFMEDAYEIDVDALADGERVVVGAIMQHIEEAGVHSGDSACILPPYKVSQYHLNIIREYTERLGLALQVKGLLNIQYAIKEDVVYVLEVNPRASRTVPFASKATALPMARIAAWVMAGGRLDELGIREEPVVDGFFVKEAVLPFRKLPSLVTSLGPEMRSTGEVMGHAAHFGHAFAKSQLAAGTNLPLSGRVLISVNDYDKGAALKIARDLHRMGFELFATPGTAAYFSRVGLPVTAVNKVSQGSPHVVDWIEQGKIDLILNTPLGPMSHSEGALIRSAAAKMNVPLLTTLSAAAAAIEAIRALKQQAMRYRSLQDHYAHARGRRTIS
ncbi:MAG TPA: carbamoyl-phosphate synthase large subunit [Anaerolinea thermolimosa]|uniref:Carbamoyl phosphate synthase large chain n=1 Tax=Anaerolinea thermolimosa TaxID=229919 RepID=A0A3D1JJ85_9CHLR|nr:carbamoyl-phosphate synthase large subunit [Anaerolinea thermolimosa]GAP07835.1 carbamoyl-phosphate synthase, large subunit [Anaerolinea thermolimosa]HCE18563.1 carbamoyl-phosphate synthase large subunit [Anaerolinea thermolimosa]